MRTSRLFYIHGVPHLLKHVLPTVVFKSEASFRSFCNFMLQSESEDKDVDDRFQYLEVLRIGLFRWETFTEQMFVKVISRAKHLHILSFASVDAFRSTDTPGEPSQFFIDAFKEPTSITELILHSTSDDFGSKLLEVIIAPKLKILQTEHPVADLPDALLIGKKFSSTLEELYLGWMLAGLTETSTTVTEIPIYPRVHTLEIFGSLHIDTVSLIPAFPNLSVCKIQFDFDREDYDLVLHLYEQNKRRQIQRNLKNASGGGDRPWTHFDSLWGDVYSVAAFAPQFRIPHLNVTPIIDQRTSVLYPIFEDTRPVQLTINMECMQFARNHIWSATGMPPTLDVESMKQLQRLTLEVRNMGGLGVSTIFEGVTRFLKHQHVTHLALRLMGIRSSHLKETHEYVLEEFYFATLGRTIAANMPSLTFFCVEMPDPKRFDAWQVSRPTSGTIRGLQDSTQIIFLEKIPRAIAVAIVRENDLLELEDLRVA
ncbi:unnamed protein product [Somion occarium]